MTIHTAAKSGGGKRQRGDAEPNRAGGNAAWRSSSHPTKGSDGLRINGLRPSRHAQRYQSATGAILPPMPRAKGTVNSKAVTSTAVTAAGASHQASTFGKSRSSGLAGAGSTPSDENTS